LALTSTCTLTDIAQLAFPFQPAGGPLGYLLQRFGLEDQRREKETWLPIRPPWEKGPPGSFISGAHVQTSKSTTTFFSTVYAPSPTSSSTDVGIFAQLS